MGKQEQEVRVRARKADLKKNILSVVQAAGVLAVASVAPNVLGAMGKMGTIPARRQKESIAASRERLLKQGLLISHEGLLHLSKKGEQVLRMLELKDYQLRKPKRWDNKWRLLIFDISERRRGLRDKIRHILLTIGFVRLQDSVWAYPYDCEDTLTLLKADLRIGKEVLYIIADSIENDRLLRDTFSLS
jgi:DNA-binding transcriptional regulator PaaX